MSPSRSLPLLLSLRCGFLAGYALGVPTQVVGVARRWRCRERDELERPPRTVARVPSTWALGSLHRRRYWASSPALLRDKILHACQKPVPSAVQGMDTALF